jgi:hypothetical protein
MTFLKPTRSVQFFLYNFQEASEKLLKLFFGFSKVFKHYRIKFQQIFSTSEPVNNINMDI